MIRTFVSVISLNAVLSTLIASPSSVGAQTDNSLAAHSGQARCSNRTLAGEYGLTIEGVILQGVQIPLRGVVLQRYDGRGNITQVDHVVTNGVPPAQEWTPGTGTYTVNADCTGVGVLYSASSPYPLNFHFVVMHEGKEIRQVVDGNAVIATGRKIE